ncbi:MAG: twin-arginine translocation signal domain-containing protein [Phormidesmis sp. FL-bin-119]|nr:twin-arginine translocation signal domain-containing protein [Pedobacter sp.]
MALQNFNRRQFVTAAASAGAIAAFVSISPVLSNPVHNEALAFPIKETTWKKIGNTIYGAKANEQGPIGGGEGYKSIVTKGDFIAEDLETLIEVLSKAQFGQVVFIPGKAIIDMTTFIYIAKTTLKIPEGVTLASDRGHNGSMGAQITSDSLDTPLMIQILGPNVRISGIRLQGPNPKRYLDHHKRAFGTGGPGSSYYYKFPTSNGINIKFPKVEIDNCEISAFSHAGVNIPAGNDHHIHHNFIHKCQYNGLGYGVALDASTALIEYNIFNENRHSLAGTGRIGCSYTARHNIHEDISLSHCFDMHGGRDRKDNTTIAGTLIEIYNNTFYAPQTAVVIRGVPQEKCDVRQNWLATHQDAKKAVRAEEKTFVHDNLYGSNPSKAS